MGKTLLLLSLVYFGFSASAGAADSKICAACDQLKQASQFITAGNKEKISEGREILSSLEFSKNAAVRKSEIEAYVEFAAKIVRIDEEGDSDSYFFNAYTEYPKEFVAAIKRLGDRDRKVLEESLANSENIEKNGNGAK